MSIYQHMPHPRLSPCVYWFWYYVDYHPGHERQHVLPDGTLELIINLQDTPRKLFDRQDPARYQAFRRGWVSGAHTHYLVIDALPGSSMIGVHFKPGGAAAFLGSPAGELSEQVVELDAIWGEHIWEWRDKLLCAPGPAAKFRLLEELVLRRLAESRAQWERRTAVTWALDQFMREPHLQSMAEVSSKIGMSHKHFIELFRRQVGLTPKKFCRIRRFQEVLRQLQSSSVVDWAGVACDCGYFDQAHFINDFVAFSGINPSSYLAHRLQGDPNFIRAVE